MKDKINKVTSKIRNSKAYDFVSKNKKKVVGVTLSVFIVFIFTFTMYNLNNPTYFNKLFASIGEAPANSAFKDKDFYYCVIDQYNIQNSTSKAYTDSLTDEELESITSLDCSGKGIEDASGVEKLTNLTNLNLGRNYKYGYYSNRLTSINLSKNIALETLNLGYNNLKEVDLSSNTALTELDLSNNYLTSIDLSKNTALISLNLGNKNGSSGNELTELDLSNNTALTYLDLEDSELTEIDLKNNTKLEYLNLEENYDIIEINLTNNVNLTELNLHFVEITSIDLSQNTKLKHLDLGVTHLRDINLENNTELTYLNLEADSEYSLGMNYLDLSNNTKLEYLNLSDNYLVRIDFSILTSLKELIFSDSNLKEIDLSNNINLTELDLDHNKLTEIDLSNNINLKDLHLDDNPLMPNEILLQVGETYEIDDSNIKLPEGKSITYSISSYNSSVAKIDGKKVTALSEGEIGIDIYVDGYNAKDINSSSYNIYQTSLIIGKVKLSHDHYSGITMNEEEEYVYISRFETPMELNKNYIDEYFYSNYGDVILEDNKIKVVKNDKTYLEYDFIYLETGYYTTSEDFYTIISSNENPNKYNIKAVNCTYEFVNDGKEIVVKYKGKEIDRRKVMYMYLPDNYYTIANDLLVSSKEEKIDVSNFKTITNINEIDESKINVLNGVVKYNEYGDLIICDPENENEEEYEYLDTVNIISNNYDLSKDYIYLGNKDFDNDIRINDELNVDYFVKFEVQDNYLYIIGISQEIKIYKWDLIKVTSEEYLIEEDKINLNYKDKNIDLSKIKVVNATLEVKDNKLLVKYNDEVVKELSVVNKKVNNATTTKVTTTTKKETTTSKNNESNVTTKKDTTTKKKTTTKKESIIDKIFKKDTTSKKEETTTKTSSNNIENNTTTNTKQNTVKKSTIKTTTKVVENNISNKIKNGIRMLKNASKPMIILLGLIGIILLIYIIILLNRKNKKED